MISKAYGYMINREKLRPSPIGSKFREDNTLIRNADGSRELRKLGDVNQYEMIQSFVDGVDLQRMISRYKKGDVTALDVKRGFYADVTEVQKDYKQHCDFATDPLIRSAYNTAVNAMKNNSVKQDPAPAPVEEVPDNG